MSSKSRYRRKGRPGPGTQTQVEQGAEQEIEIKRQLALTFEQEPYARWVTAGGLPRMASMLIGRRKRRRRGEWVPPLPWRMFVLTAGIFLAAFGLAVLLVVFLRQ